jgi:polysaccharide biosynthesis PFTS motif protein
VLELSTKLKAFAANVGTLPKNSLEGQFSAPVVERRLRQIVVHDQPHLHVALFNYFSSAMPVILPLPTPYLEFLESQGITVNRAGSRQLLTRLRWRKLGEAVYVFLILLTQIRLPKNTAETTTVFFNLNSNNTFGDAPRESYSFFGWFRREFCSEKKIGQYIAVNWGRKINPVSGLQQCRFPYPNCRNHAKRLQFMLSGFNMMIRDIFSIISGEESAGLLLRDEIEARYIDLVDQRDLPGRYVLDSGQWSEKPLWLEAVERRGREVIVFHYSANNVPFSHKIPPLPIVFLPEWRHQVIWTEAQKSFLNSRYPSAKFTEVSYIDYADSSELLPSGNSKLWVSIFDVEPVRSSLAIQLGIPLDAIYYSLENSIAFFEAINECALAHPEIQFIMKRKRQRLTRTISQGMIKRIDKVIDFSRILSVDETISARRVIERSAAVISMPFTSPGVIASKLKIPSVYYDPSGQVTLDHFPSAKVLNSVDQLLVWLERCLAKQSE